MKLFPPYTTTVTATDVSGNSRECVLHFAVVDTEGPVLSCPTYSNNMILSVSKFSWSVFTDRASNSAQLYWSAANATDNSGTVVFVTSNYNPGDVFPASNVSHQITYTAIDKDNNVGNCSFYITVEDLESPSVECRSHLHSKSNFLTWNITLSDNVGVVHWMANDSRVVPSNSTLNNTYITLQQNGTFSVGTSFIEYVVRDMSGNVEECLLAITVEDLERPSIICPSNFSNYYDYVFGFHRLVADYGQSYATVTWPSPEVNDNSQEPITWESFPYKSGDKFPLRRFPPYTVQFTATDLTGNNRSCYVYFTIIDVEPPIITCPTNITNYHDTYFGIVRAATDPGSSTSSVTWDYPTVSDNSQGVVNVKSSYQSGNSFAPKLYPPYEVEFTAEDESGNKNSCKLYFLVTGTVNEQTIKSDVSVASSTMPNGIYTAEDTNNSISTLVSTPSILSRISLSTSLSLSSSTSLTLSSSSSSSSLSPLSSSPLATPSQYFSLPSSSSLMSFSSSSPPPPSSVPSSLSSSSLLTTQTPSTLPSTLLSSQIVTDEVVNTLHRTNSITEDDDVKHQTLINDQENTVHQTTDQQLTNFFQSTDPQPTEFTDRQLLNQHTTEKQFISRQYTFYTDKVSVNQQPSVDPETINTFSTDPQYSTKQQSIEQTIYSPSQNTLLNNLSTEETVINQRFTSSSINYKVSSSKNENSEHTLYELNSTVANELSVSDNLYRMSEDILNKSATSSSRTSRIADEAKLKNTKKNGIDGVTMVVICLSLIGGLLIFISVIIIIKKKILDKSAPSLHYSDANVFDSDRTSINICDLELLNKEPRTRDGFSNCAYISDVKDSQL
ncbi:hyalin-like isoform X1 [Anneissia japonica]|uniref:hyalin-like isoform X1 n=1 Tax=Anneissia japonica TaxID=1529436 RepID=UPI0014257A58|nr:hyalin-like isoform X1 [Anneissia japonica]